MYVFVPKSRTVSLLSCQFARMSLLLVENHTSHRNVIIVFVCLIVAIVVVKAGEKKLWAH